MTLHALALILCLPAQPGISGYVESRPCLLLRDSLAFSGYSRGWLEFKQDDAKYGGQAVLDCAVPYDSGLFSIPEQVKISRLALWIGPENLRVTAGRQRLYWGVGRVFRPLDILNPANYLEPGYEKPGTDALLGYAAFGSTTSLRAVVVPKSKVDRSLAGFRLAGNLLRNDLGLDVFNRRSGRMTMIGAEIAGEAGIGYWSEPAYVFEDTGRYPKISAGIDYTFPFSLYAMIEFLHDGSGAGDPAEYDYSKLVAGERSFLAKDYLYGSLELGRNPYLKPSLAAIVNLDDRGFILVPQFYYSVLDNVDLTIGADVVRGSRISEFKNAIPADLILYVWLKIYY